MAHGISGFHLYFFLNITNIRFTTKSCVVITLQFLKKIRSPSKIVAVLLFNSDIQLKPIAHPRLIYQEPRLGRIRLNFFSELSHIDVQILLLICINRSPYLL